jgi:hypothetical protein
VEVKVWLHEFLTLALVGHQHATNCNQQPVVLYQGLPAHQFLFHHLLMSTAMVVSYNVGVECTPLLCLHHILVSHAAMEICYFCFMVSTYVTFPTNHMRISYYCRICYNNTAFMAGKNTAVWTPAKPHCPAHSLIIIQTTLIWRHIPQFYGHYGQCVPPKRLYPTYQTTSRHSPHDHNMILTDIKISTLKACIYDIRTKPTQLNQDNNNTLDNHASSLVMTSCRPRKFPQRLESI